MKTCTEIQLEIENVRKMIQQEKLKHKFNKERNLISDSLCANVNPLVKCEYCNCWKVKDIHNETAVEN